MFLGIGHTSFYDASYVLPWVFYYAVKALMGTHCGTHRQLQLTHNQGLQKFQGRVCPSVRGRALPVEDLKFRLDERPA